MLQTQFDAETALVTFCFHGRMDTAACGDAAPLVEQELDKGLAAVGSRLEARFDLAETTYVSSTFLRICVAAAKRVEPAKFAIINTAPALKKVFKMASLDRLCAVS